MAVEAHAARARGSSSGTSPARRWRRGCRPPRNGSRSSPEAAPWQASQPTPSEPGTRRRAARPGWRGSRGTRRAGGLAEAEPGGDRLAARLAQHRQARLCAPAGADGSCQRRSRPGARSAPLPSARPWQVDRRRWRRRIVAPARRPAGRSPARSRRGAPGAGRRAQCRADRQIAARPPLEHEPPPSRKQLRRLCTSAKPPSEALVHGAPAALVTGRPERHRARPPREAAAMTKASDLFIECLEDEGVEYVFGVPGEENLDFLDCAVALDEDQADPDPARAGRRLHGRDLRPPHRQDRRLPRDARARARPTSSPPPPTPSSAACRC